MTRIFDHPLNQIHVLGHVYMNIISILCMLTIFTHCVYSWQVDVTANEFPLRFVCLKPAIDNINELGTYVL
jgi:hypothetical protein